MNEAILIRLKDIIDPQPTYTTPDGATELTVTAAAGAWAQGSWAEVIAADTVASPVRVISFEVVAITGTHQLEVGFGAAGSEVAKGKITIFTTGTKFIRVPEADPNVRIALRTASKAGGSETIKVHMNYEYRP